MKLKDVLVFGCASALSILSVAMPPTARGQEVKLGPMRIAGVIVTGLTPHQARQKLEQALRAKLNTNLRITDGVKSVAQKRKDLGIGLDVENMVGQAKQGHKAADLPLKVNRETFQKVLRRLASKFTYPGRNAAPVYQHGRVRISPGQDQRGVDVGKSAETLANLIEKKPGVKVLRLVMAKNAPQVSGAMLQGVNARLSQFATRFNPASAKRTHNIRVAVGRINGRLLRPGQTFSLNESVKERTHANGYLTATVLKNNKKAEGIGGGVSQVTGTLFNAALLSGLKIVEYTPHSRPVPYLPVGRDATVVWGVRDLKIKNNTQAPVYIAYEAVGNQCRATVYGARQPGVKIRLAVQKKKPGPTHVLTDLYRIVTKNGKQIAKEKIGHADYDWKPETQQD